MMQLTVQDLQNVLNLIAVAPITGAQSEVVAALRTKLITIINETINPLLPAPPPEAPA